MKQDGKEFSPASNAMLQQAADGELVLWAFIRRHTAKLLAFSLAVAPTQEPTKATRSCAAGLVPIMPELANELMGFPSAKLKNYRATDPSDCPDSHPWKDYYWVLDEPQAVTLEQVYFQGVTVASAGDDPAPDLPQSEAAPAMQTDKRWTPEKLAELRAYRDSHTMPKTALEFGISEQRIRQLLPSNKPKAKPWPGVIHRTK